MIAEALARAVAQALAGYRSGEKGLCRAQPTGDRVRS